jgi:hypothetical protein
MQDAVVTQLDVRADHAERPYAHVVSNSGKWRDNGGRVDHRANFGHAPAG